MDGVKWAEYLSKVKPKTRQWIWPERIPLGEITLIAGIQGTGKSILTAKFASHITMDINWPDGTSCDTGDVILLQAEDSDETTVRPRFDAAGADPERVLNVKGAPFRGKDRKVKIGPFELNRDLTTMVKLIEQANTTKAIIIDPIGAYIGDIDIHRENQVRSVMFKIKQIAEKYNVAFIIVVHLRKGGTDDPVLSRVLGSTAFTGAARAVWGVAQSEDESERRLFVPMKHNLTPGAALGYDFYLGTASNGAGFATWGKPISDLADDVMKDVGEKVHGQVGKAIDVIKDALKAGPQASTYVREKVIVEGHISERTMNTAKKQMKIKSVKKGNQWIWSLP